MDVLLRVYARCIAGQQEEAKRRILEATKPGQAKAIEFAEPATPAGGPGAHSG